VRVAAGGQDAVVAQDFLHLQQIDAGLDQVGGIAVAQAVGGDLFLSPQPAGARQASGPVGKRLGLQALEPEAQQADRYCCWNASEKSAVVEGSGSVDRVHGSESGA
jgi:hypothetical protein